jgi:tetratricopeptide (TPR) repeat protein
MKKLILFSVFLSSIQFLAVSSELTGHYDSLYTLGNNSYQEQKFEDALKSYNSISESGMLSSDLYYNMGNCYYKLNQITEAILYYERALKMRPNGEDIKYNLSLANKLIVDKIETLPTPFYREWWNTLVSSFSMDIWGFTSIGFTVLGMISLLFFLMTRSTNVKQLSFYLFLVFLLSAGLTYFFAKAQHRQNIKEQYAIIFDTRTNIYSEPNTTSTVLFVIHNGLKVKILKTSGQWLNIMLPDGSIGWIPEETLMMI